MTLITLILIKLVIAMGSLIFILLQRRTIRSLSLSNHDLLAKVNMQEDQAKKLQEENNLLSTQLARSEAKRENEEEKNKHLDEIRKQMILEFGKVSQEIVKEQKIQFHTDFKEKSEDFQKRSEEKLLGFTRPLHENLSEFRQKIAEYEKTHLHNNGRFEKILEDLNTTTTTLSTAFMKEKKLRGNWGEQQLVLILEQSGLIENRDFETAVSVKTADGSQQHLDILLALPGERHIVVDAKTPFNHYQKMQNAPSEEEKKEYQKSFLTDVKKHITDLSAKKYPESLKKQKLLKAPPVTLMFLPIESGYLLAMEDESLQKLARDSKIMLCSPQTFFGISQTIAHIWTLYHQNQNALGIFSLSQNIIEKLESVHGELYKLETSFHNGISKLRKPFEGKKGLRSLANQLDNLGVKNSLPKEEPSIGDSHSLGESEQIENMKEPLSEKNHFNDFQSSPKKDYSFVQAQAISNHGEKDYDIL